MRFEQTELPPERVKGTSNPEKIVEGSKEQRDLLSIVVEGKANLKKLELLMQNYPEFFESNPALTENLAGLQRELAWADARGATCSPAEMDQFKQSYNQYANRVNEGLLTLVKGETSASLEEDLKQSTQELAKSLNETQKKELESFVLAHWDELFPPSYSEKMYKELKETTTFDDYSLAYASGVINGAEVTVKGFLSLLDPQTYKDLGDAFRTLPQITLEDANNMGTVLKEALFKSDWPDRVFFLTTVVVSTLMVGGIIGRLKQGALALELPPAIKTLTSTARFSRAACALQLLSLFEVGMGAENLGEAGQAVPAYSMPSVPFRKI